MAWHELATAVGLVLVLEGIGPFLAPARWQRAVATLMTIAPHRLRWVGLGSMLLGAALLQWLRKG